MCSCAWQNYFLRIRGGDAILQLSKHAPATDLHVLDVLVEGHEVLSVVLGEEAAQLGELILHVFVLDHPDLEVLAEVLP